MTGTVTVDDITITHKTKDKYIRPVRKRIGMVFQFPESQLFEDTVEREMIFGPKNFKINLDEAEKLCPSSVDGFRLFKRCNVTITISNVRWTNA